MNILFMYEGKKLFLDVDVCDSLFSHARGLMFRKKSKPLLFLFSSTRKRKIHSFFCVPFVAIWFREGRIIESQYVTPWKLSVSPRESFDMLLEVPSTHESFRFFPRR